MEKNISERPVPKPRNNNKQNELQENGKKEQDLVREVTEVEEGTDSDSDFDNVLTFSVGNERPAGRVEDSREGRVEDSREDRVEDSTEGQTEASHEEGKVEESREGRVEDREPESAEGNRESKDRVEETRDTDTKAHSAGAVVGDEEPEIEDEGEKREAQVDPPQATEEVRDPPMVPPPPKPPPRRSTRTKEKPVWHKDYVVGQQQCDLSRDFQGEQLERIFLEQAELTAKLLHNRLK